MTPQEADARRDLDLARQRLARLEADNARLRRERDAAVRDLHFDDKCWTCKHATVSMAEPPCNECRYNPTSEYGLNVWEWRGVKEDGAI